MYPTLEQRFDAAMTKADGYQVLEIAGADPTIGIAPSLAGNYFSAVREKGNFEKALEWARSDYNFLAPVLTMKAQLQCSRMLGVLARC
jgi:hypothetical protein